MHEKKYKEFEIDFVTERNGGYYYLAKDGRRLLANKCLITLKAVIDKLFVASLPDRLAAA